MCAGLRIILVIIKIVNKMVEIIIILMQSLEVKS
jgi:hypothetical protein